MKYCRFVSSIAQSIVASAFFATVGIHAALAQPHTAVHGGWQITIDESPSSEFVAQALVDLKEYFKPPEVNLNLPWCCYVGNYGGIVDPIETDDGEIPFFRLTDDLDEVSDFFRTYWSSTLCDEGICSTITQFNLVQGGPTELMTHLREAVEPDFDPIDNGSIAFLKLDDGAFPEYGPIDPNYDPTDTDYFDYFKWKLEYGVYPVYVGRVGPQQLSPVVWSVTLSATPEPSSAILCLMAAMIVGLYRRRD